MDRANRPDRELVPELLAAGMHLVPTKSQLSEIFAGDCRGIMPTREQQLRTPEVRTAMKVRECVEPALGGQFGGKR